MSSDVVMGIGRLLWDVYEPRLQEQFKYHPNGGYLLEQMKNGELSPDEVDSAFIAAEAYMAQEVFQNTSQDREIKHVRSNDTVTFEIYRGVA